MKKPLVWEQLAKFGHKEMVHGWGACARAFAAAGGAGLLTALTAVLKYLIAHSSFALLTAAILGAVNFVVSFLLIQGAGLRLATKQSTLLGAALGGRAKTLGMRIRTTVGSYYAVDGAAFTSLSTQLVSALGNLMIVIPAGFVLHRLLRLGSFDPLPSPEAAHAVLASLQPTRVDTLAYACLTGAMLFFCTWVGALIARKTRLFSKSTASLGFNVLLGILLAAVPYFGKLLHAPLDVRHFALSGGALGMAASSLGWSSALAAGILPAMAGVLVIGLLNFSVSFALAFASASLTPAPAAS